jgi:xylulokinase
VTDTAVFVGLDVGTSSTKGLSIRRDGCLLAKTSAAHGAPPTAAGTSEQHPGEWVASARRVLAELGVERPAGLGVTGQMHGLVLLDGRGEVLRPAILWNDGRATRERAELEEAHGVPWLLERTANRALPGLTAASLLWVKRHEPDVWRRIRHVMLPKDYVRMELSGGLAGGAPVTDVSDASGTLLFDVSARRWSRELLDVLELSPDRLPVALESHDLVGRMPDGAPVAAGAGDQAAAALGLGLHDGGPLGVALGTSGVVTGIRGVADPIDPLGRLQTICAARPDGWQTLGVTLSAAGSLAWWSGVAGAGVGELLSAAAERPAGGDGLHFLPYLSGERAPHMDADARGAFVGLSAHHDRAAMTRAVVEGVACSLADVLEIVRDGLPAERARITGRAARSELFAQILAAVLGLPLERVALDEGPAYGAALLGAIAAGALADHEEAAALVWPTDVVEPDRNLQELYAEHLETYRTLYPALHPGAVPEPLS